MTAYKAITGSQGGLLTKAAQYLVVRFGLYALLHRTVSTLSTGEIRKVLLVRALAQRPRLLLLDNALDGLDVASREKLQTLISQLIRGFRPDMLVQGVSAHATAHTQVVFMTHRPEEIVDELEHVSVVVSENGASPRVESGARDGRSGTELMELLESSESTNDSSLRPLPSLDEIQNWWNMDCSSHQTTTTTVHLHDKSPLVRLENFSMMVPQPDENGDTLHVSNNHEPQPPKQFLLQNIDWTVQPGEHWLVAGGNGAGKSTLSRILAQYLDPTLTTTRGHVQVLSSQHSEEYRENATRRHQRQRSQVGWVSTEWHMATVSDPERSRITAWNMIREHCDSDRVAQQMAQWLGLMDDTVLSQPGEEQILIHRPFAQLSQGQQKMVLLCAALASRPPLLVLDEPCQGLDVWNRTRLLQMVERLCQHSSVVPTTRRRHPEMSLIYITHHHQEEVQPYLPSISKVIHLADGQTIFQGSREAYFDNFVAGEQQRNDHDTISR
eukprot:CAMPEP_0172446748 /NCGR_PEP_ID=MMETSP1065-20121228/6276_1 /TAXON_ID=265537 /ORGANISM="Amphiprora paludosa, Strain CCMP125" /LENGTH=496 /DNA_ID=CAMNT_0013197937 /DNA_START=70 /DNA_END=1560 /DNA_ORIENTATION=+